MSQCELYVTSTDVDSHLLAAARQGHFVPHIDLKDLGPRNKSQVL